MQGCMLVMLFLLCCALVPFFLPLAFVGIVGTMAIVAKLIIPIVAILSIWAGFQIYKRIKAKNQHIEITDLPEA